jgi:hypothetical protein
MRIWLPIRLISTFDLADLLFQLTDAGAVEAGWYVEIHPRAEGSNPDG